MCVIAGYIGNLRAAPILLEMLRREEGLAAGFYTGISTLHEGVLHHAKVIGDVNTLIAETDALNFPGTIGIAHGRTPGGGGRAWAHPFISTDGKLAYIANGSMAKYEKWSDFPSDAARLLEAGYRLDSAQPGPVGSYPLLPDGRAVHFSDIVCQAISEAYQKGAARDDRLLQAAMAIYQSMPGSKVGLCLHADHPDEIVGVRHNKPLELGRFPDGSFVIASAALAFPEGVKTRFRMPHLTGARFHRNGTIDLRPFSREDLIPVGPSPSPAALMEICTQQLGTGKPVSARQFTDAFAPLWPAHQLNEKEVVAYEILRALANEGRVALREHRVPGVDGKGTAPQLYVYPLGM